MSLLKRIESARPGSSGSAPAPGGPPAPAGPGQPAGGPPTLAPAQRLLPTAPVRESFRDVKFRIQSRVISDLDPKLDLSNQVEVRRQIE
jgi:pilus assembly protein CpaF